MLDLKREDYKVKNRRARISWEDVDSAPYLSPSILRIGLHDSVEFFAQRALRRV
jgi:hypothetical protein